MNIKCKICKCSFEWERNGRGGRQPTICLTSECRKIRDRLCYEKWKENHPITRYEKNKERKKSENTSKAIPKAKSKIKHYCQRCGVLLIENRMNCPACRTFLTDRVAGDDYIFLDGNLEDITLTLPVG